MASGDNAINRTSLGVSCEVVREETDTAEEREENEKLQQAATKFSHKLPCEKVYKGMLVNEMVTVEGLTALSKLSLQSDDVIICGYPKSGTTWLYEMLYLLLCGSNRSEECARRNGTNPNPLPISTHSTLIWLDDQREHSTLATSSRPRIVKTHVPVSLMPTSAFKDGSKIVLGIRNPRDVAVSYYYFHQLSEDFGNFEVEFSEFAEMFRCGYVHWGSWTRHVRDWWHRAKTDPNVFPVFYEETKRNPQQAVKDLAQFLSVDVTEDDVNLIVETSSFSNMKERARKKSHFSYMFRRKGEVGDWKNHFSQQESSLYDAWVREQIQDQELLDRLQCELPQ